MNYNHEKIEKKWQGKWAKSGIYQAEDNSKKPKYYCLIEFPYPSGAGLHVGHLRSHIAIDIVARKKRMDGFNVLYPIGWDAFGLPTENYAIKTKTHPRIVTENNIKNFTKQIKSYGPSFDWSREINTTDPEYYKWTQWIFLKLFNSFYNEKLDKARPIKELKIPKNLNKDEKRKYIDNHRMAYELEMAINWCPSCKIGLANEEVVNGACERCGVKAEKKTMKQWMLKITKYADRLIKDLDMVDYLDKIKIQQVNWIGKSSGTKIKFSIIFSTSSAIPAQAGIQKTGKVVLIHGKNTDPTQKWYPWFAKKIKKHGIKFIAPVLPEADDPNINAWMNKIEKTRPNQDTILIGHSRGGVAILRWLEQLPKNKKVKKVILVAANSGDSKKRNKTENNKGFFIKEGYDFEKIKKHCNDIIVFHSKDDEWVPFKAGEENAKGLNAKFYSFKDKGHFGKKITDFPELLEEILDSRLRGNDKMENIEVFTTRPDTLFGCTYMVLSPEHPLVASLLKVKSQKSKVKNIAEVAKYIEKAKNKSDLERTDLAKEKTGVELKGIKAINPVNNEEIPIWIADYILASYGTGAIMAVPAHDFRDYEFAKKYNLPIRQVVKQEEGEEMNCIIIHGSDFEDKERTKRKDFVPQNKRHWISWTKKELKKRGIKIFTPLMPKNWAPVYEDWKKEFEKLKINKDTILIGHSSGGNFLVRWLSETKKRVKKLILIAPSKIYPDFYEDFYKKFDNYKIDEKIKERVDKIIIFISNNDKKYILQSVKIYQRELNAKLVKLENRGHFIIKHNPINKKFQELLDEILKQELDEAFTGDGVNVNSDFLDGLKTEDVKKKMINWLEKNKLGKKAVNYKLRDWVFSRQHYWGEPIPIVKCEKCGNIILKEKDLPLELPEVKNYKPTETGESPLAKIKKWTDVKCPKCGKPAKRETDTMPNWAGSSWYFLRYIDSKNNKEFASQKNIKYWMPVDLYNGGMEHTTLHLLYSRFWHKFLFDLGYVNTSEPYKKRRSHGMILAEDGQKMSKSRGNVINPDDIIKKYGADTLRLYEMFIGPYAEAIPWNTNSLIGMNRFLKRIWEMRLKVHKVESIEILIATNNKGKLKEFKDHLNDYNIVSLKNIDKKIEEPVENGKIFADNSLLKAKYYAKKTGYLTIADDSGLCVNALGGRPGVYSSRYANGDDKKGCIKLINELKNKSDRSAYYKSVITIYNPENNKYKQFEGKCEGKILNTLKGDKSFGYAPIFKAKNLDKSFGECSSQERYKYNHRKQAIDKLIEYLNENQNENLKIERLFHKTIKKVMEDIQDLKFNTAISQLMILLNEFEKEKELSADYYSKFLILLSPFAPHVAEELWSSFASSSDKASEDKEKYQKFIFLQPWPKYNPKLIKEKEIELVIQINGKVRDKIKTQAGILENEAKKIALESEKIKKWIKNKEIRKIIFIKGKLINIVV